MRFIFLGAILGFIGVAAGAFGAHGLEDKLEPRMLQNWETAARYQMYHALAMVFVGFFSVQHPSSLIQAAGWSFLAGAVVFSGSLYALALSGVRLLGAITPIGGVGFLAGWLCLAIAAVKWNS